ncbi:putative ubiquitin carboxyl-terminal hydrolase MINDY-4 [Lamellibrachia satsuma]|nr:putative ubiquitin carboxyl-terminal hydrolase MINDY-4 [Lamellibrachia satsuma]
MAPAVKQSMFRVDSKAIDVQTAVDLKKLLFGSANQKFNNEWQQQAFTFCDIPGLQYGLIQKKGGSCGIMASVQAHIILHLVFLEQDSLTLHKRLSPSRQQRSEVLAKALANIFWKAGQNCKATVVIPSMQSYYTNTTRCKTDGLTETLMLSTFTNYDELLAFVQMNIRQFELDGSSGVVLALYSAILSCTVEQVKSDMDEPSSKLMGAHGYCTQEMVNLFLTGKARSNVFNDVMELENDTGPALVLKGIDCRQSIGFLSLFEHYQSCQVGTYMKTPKFPIWVVCSESHFSVLFCLKRELMNDWKAERRFELYYYDGLARQDQEIKLSIDTTNRFFQPPSDNELVPPLDMCIRTKWKDAEVDWNGTDPLL